MEMNAPKTPSGSLDQIREALYQNIVNLRSATEFTKLDIKRRNERERQMQIRTSEQKDSHRKGNQQ